MSSGFLPFSPSSTDYYTDYETEQNDLIRRRAQAEALYGNITKHANALSQSSIPGGGMAAALESIVGAWINKVGNEDITQKQLESNARRNSDLKDYISNWPTDTPGSQQYDIPSAAVGLPDFMGGPTQPEQQAPHQVSRQESLAYALKGAGLGQFGNKIAEAAVVKSLNPEKAVYHVEEIGGANPGEKVKMLYDANYRPIRQLGGTQASPTDLQKNVDFLTKGGYVPDEKSAIELVLGKGDYAIINGNPVPLHKGELSGLQQPTPVAPVASQNKFLPYGVSETSPGLGAQFEQQAAAGQRTVPPQGINATDTPQQAQRALEEMQRAQGIGTQAFLPSQTISDKGLPPIPKKLGDAIIPDPKYIDTPGGATEFGRPLTGVYAQKPLPPGSINMDPTNKEGLKALYGDVQKMQEERKKEGIDNFEHWLNEADKIFKKYGDKPIPGLGYAANLPMVAVGRDEAQQNQVVFTNLVNAVAFAMGGKTLTPTELSRNAEALGVSLFQNEQTARLAIGKLHEALASKDNSVKNAYAPDARTLLEDRLNFGKAQADAQEKATKATAATAAGKQPLSAMPKGLSAADQLRWMETNWKLVDDR